MNPRMFMLLPDNKEILQWISEKKEPGEARINLGRVSRMHFGSNDTQRLKKLKSKLKGREHMCLAIVSDTRQAELVFDSDQ